jgi:hypothetical protein
VSATPSAGCQDRSGLKIRCDWGPLYIADAWINEVKWLGMTISSSYVGEPECNGIIGALHAHAEGQCLDPHRFATLTEACRIIGESSRATMLSGPSVFRMHPLVTIDDPRG